MDIANLYGPFLCRIGLNRIALPILSKLLLHILFIFGTISLKTIVVEAQKELMPWRENRYINCIFCMDYDNHKNLEIYGCNLKNTPICKGNICYMRQHKQDNWLYTSGCLNLTQAQFSNIIQETSLIKADRGGLGNETILCEVTTTMNTCVCTNRSLCNNGSSLEAFTEYNGQVLTNMDFNEVAHFKYFLPNDPIVEDELDFWKRNFGCPCLLINLFFDINLNDLAKGLWSRMIFSRSSTKSRFSEELVHKFKVSNAIISKTTTIQNMP
uniref:Uncharacterized protein n=1 Tax=Acrobeloides nanus TaxID=290746 RepID=A0A914DWG3_9BILA